MKLAQIVCLAAAASIVVGTSALGAPGGKSAEKKPVTAGTQSQGKRQDGVHGHKGGKGGNSAGHSNKDGSKHPHGTDDSTDTTDTTDTTG